MKIRDVYRGVDPLIEKLIQALIEGREEIERLASRLRIYENIGKEDEQINVQDWKGINFFNFFKTHYRNTYDEFPPVPYVNERFTGAKISKFINDYYIDKNTYYEYVLYVLFDDPWNRHSPPTAERLWNLKMFQLYMRRVEGGTVRRRRAIPSKPKVVFRPDLKLSPEAKRLAEKKAMED